jgi:ferric-dicitrate binding protein FerR (iron transport regulator)
MTIRHTEGDTETSWKEGKIVFNDTPFNEVLRVLSKRYNVQFIVDTKKYDDDAFTGSFTTQQIGQVLTVFKASSGVRWKYEEANESEKVQRIRIY